MEFVVLLSVFAITLTQVIALPIVTKDDTTKDGNADNADKFKLPKALVPNFKITINGTLNSSEKKFKVALPNDGNEENLHCTLNYNHLSKVIEVSPPFNNDEKPEEFEIFYEEGEDFILEMMAKETAAGKMMEMILTVIGSGTSKPMYCSIKSFEELGHIYFKEGVKYIKTILFTFSD